MLLEFNPNIRAAIKARRIERDCGILLAAPANQPIPMRIAPWQPGPIDHALLYPGDRPWSVHTWLYFEVFHSVGALLERWIIDDSEFSEDRAAREGSYAYQRD